MICLHYKSSFLYTVNLDVEANQKVAFEDEPKRNIGLAFPTPNVKSLYK